MKRALFLDAGHGGVNESGVYTTAPGKMWKHPSGTFHNGTTFYEGVSNRLYADLIANEMFKRGCNVVKVYHPVNDTSLKVRTDIANAYHKDVQQGFYLSIHSNAVNKQNAAKGLSVWTSRCKTQSDVFADLMCSNYNKDIDFTKFNTVLRKEISDGDWDYEADFHVLKFTAMPAVLIENLFFDNIEEVRLLLSPEYQKAFVDSTVKSLIEILK